ncbi:MULTISPECIES: alpha/beta hydrolase [Catenuloplanes]|uniref:Pimeloyl-ACP methyl ester carboxylesterase n=1 Tax=Catenuloplanes niger TaxID=587534 RepID=A0AAE3ZIG6_9ACTN|nr:alpha/beta hydrolase [Catenuloplanes niger]MDR7320554.1 pimeloyl-ACP methyl ester carboxylesterase [Catenuloplanes niger]
MRKALAMIVTAVAALAVTGVAHAESRDAAPGAVSWEQCPDIPGAECGALRVPLDYRNPDGRTIEIAISRIRSTAPEKRRGVLFTNPGGPGVAGRDFPAALVAEGLPRSVRDAYDLIGIDPRGVGRSTPVTCDLTPEQIIRGNIPPYAVTPDDVTAWARQAHRIAGQCAASTSAWMLPHVSTANAARDLDRVRVALGERTASFLGYSYGTYLGAVYTTLFPHTTDRVVLDSSLHEKGWDVDGGRAYGRGFEERFPDFAAWAAARPEYRLGRTPAQVRATYLDLAGRLDRAPVQGVDGASFRLFSFIYSYDDRRFPLMAASWKALAENQPLPVVDAAPAPAPDPENAIAARLHTVCADSRWPTAVGVYRANVAADRIRYPLFGAAAANIQPCAFWRDPVEPPVRIGDRGPATVLIAQNDRDPGTPLSGARSMRRALGDRAVMVHADQGGHGAFVFTPNRCLNTAVESFLVTGERPAHDRWCRAEAR